MIDSPSAGADIARMRHNEADGMVGELVSRRRKGKAVAG